MRLLWPLQIDTVRRLNVFQFKFRFDDYDYMQLTSVRLTIPNQFNGSIYRCAVSTVVAAGRSINNLALFLIRTKSYCILYYFLLSNYRLEDIIHLNKIPLKYDLSMLERLHRILFNSVRIVHHRKQWIQCAHRTPLNKHVHTAHVHWKHDVDAGQMKTVHNEWWQWQLRN